MGVIGIMKKVSKILEPIGVPFDSNIKFFQRECTDEEPLLVISKDKTYFEILGHKIETGKNMKSMDDLSEWLRHIKEVDEENERLKKEVDNYENRKAYLIEYLTDRLEEAKLDAQYYNGMRFANYKETIYEDLLDIVEGKYEK